MRYATQKQNKTFKIHDFLFLHSQAPKDLKSHLARKTLNILYIKNLR